MQASQIKAVNIISSLSYRVPTPRYAFSRRKNLSTSFRLLYSSSSYSHGFFLFLLGGTTGLNYNPHAVSLVVSSSYALSMSRSTVLSCFPRISSSSRPACASGTFPPDNIKPTTWMSLDVTALIFVFQPPRVLPIDCLPFLSRPLGVRMYFYCC